MTPDNKEPSDTAGEEAANDVSNEPDNEELVAESQPPADDAASVVDDDTAASGSDDVVIDDDPLGFGEQRMHAAETEPLDENALLSQQLAEAEAKAADNWDRLLRLQADMENQRKRAQNDVNKARKFALESIVNDLLPVKDSLEMGLAAAGADEVDPKSIIEGAELTLKMLAQVFEKNNIIEVNPVDEKFDPEFHQAMSMQEVEGKAPNTVTGVMQKGYTLNERLVRPALVMVSK